MITLNTLQSFYTNLIQSKADETSEVDVSALIDKIDVEEGKVGAAKVETKPTTDVETKVENARQNLYDSLAAFIGDKDQAVLDKIRAVLNLTEKGEISDGTQQTGVTKLQARQVVDLVFSQRKSVEDRLKQVLSPKITFSPKVVDMMTATLSKQSGSKQVMGFLSGVNDTIGVFKACAFVVKQNQDKTSLSLEDRLALAYLKGFSKGFSADGIELAKGGSIEQTLMSENQKKGELDQNVQLEFTKDQAAVDVFMEKFGSVFEGTDKTTVKEFVGKYIKTNLLTPSGTLTKRFPELKPDETEKWLPGVKSAVEKYFDEVSNDQKNGDQLKELTQNWLKFNKFVSKIDSTEVDKLLVIESAKGKPSNLLEKYKADFKALLKEANDQATGELWKSFLNSGKDVKDAETATAWIKTAWKAFSKSLAVDPKVTAKQAESVKDLGDLSNLKKAGDVEQGKVYRQSKGANTCYQLSLLNALLSTKGGTSIVKKCFLTEGNFGFAPACAKNITKDDIKAAKEKELKILQNDDPKATLPEATDFEWAVHIAHMKVLDEKFVPPKDLQTKALKPSERVGNLMGKQMQMSDLAEIFGVKVLCSDMFLSSDEIDRFRYEAWQGAGDENKLSVIHVGGDNGGHYMHVKGIYGSGDGEKGFNVADSMGSTATVGLDSGFTLYTIEIPKVAS